MTAFLASIPPQVKTFLRTLVGAVLVAFVAQGGDLFAVSLDDLRTWLAIGLVAAVPVVLKWLDPTESSYGLAQKVPADPAEGLADDDA